MKNNLSRACVLRDRRERPEKILAKEKKQTTARERERERDARELERERERESLKVKVSNKSRCVDTRTTLSLVNSTK